MIIRFVRDSIRRSPKRKALIVLAIALGTSVATAMLGVMLSIGDKMNVELREAGANIVVTSQAAALTGGAGGVTAGVSGNAANIQEAMVPKIKSIFWALNVTGFAPSLLAHDGDLTVQGVWFAHDYKIPGSADGPAQTSGIRAVNPSWQVAQGRWASDSASNECM